MDGAFGLVWVLVLVLVVATVFAGMKTVPQGQVWTVERFGAFMRELPIAAHGITVAEHRLRQALTRLPPGGSVELFN